jgi:NitT/TauT family transport system substrate-binding protein
MNKKLFFISLASMVLLQGQIAQADPAPLKITVSVPGPRNISYLPIDLIPMIGADKAEGAEIQLLHTGGGGVALSNLMNRNADFAVAGMPAAMSLRANGGKVTVIAAVDDAPLFILMVRSDLKGKVKRIADLKGKVVGVNTSSLSSKTTSQQLAELVLKSDGVSADMVRLIPAGQSWMEQSSLLESKTADAIMGDEPFATRLLDQNKVFFLANLADPKTSEKISGANFLHAALETREETLSADPRKVEKMVNILRRSLQWVASHTPEQIADALSITDKEERAAMIVSLKKYPRLYSKDGRLSARQLRETELFFHSTSAGNTTAQALKVGTMVADKWSGSKD